MTDVVHGIVLEPFPSTVFLTGGVYVLGFEEGVYLGLFRFLKDHSVQDQYILAGEIREMFSFWTPSADVEPLDATAVQNFYTQGPKLGGVWRTHFTHMPIYAPVTYWKGIAPNLWQLTGLGATLPPITAQIGRIEDKEP